MTTTAGWTGSTSPPAAPGPAATEAPRLWRNPRGSVLGGVARGLSEHLGLDVALVRGLFLVLALADGAGVLLYAAFWVLAPLRRGALDAAPAATSTRASSRAHLVAVGVLVLTAVVLLLSVDGASGAVVPLVVVAVGLVLVWRQADDAQRSRWRDATRATGWSGVARAVLGGVLVLGGAVVFVVTLPGLEGPAGGLLAGAAFVVGLALVSAPWWLKMARELNDERLARIREQERAEIAAHLHDSVLHTLTLIQRSVEDPREVARLARAQERELRTWLYRPAADPDTTVSAAVERAAAEVEDDHGVTVEVVVVGEAPMDERLHVTVAATREALVNAAKYAGTHPISVYAEVEPEQVTVFVRDRGPGFDLASVPADRHGVRQSVLGRMHRHGGTAVIRSSGSGTEIQLTMPRSAQ